MSAPAVKHARALVLELADEFVDGGRELAKPFLEGMARDIEAIWTVPPARQAKFLARMEKQALALPELARLHFLNTTREGFVRAIVAALRFALKVAA